MTAFTKKYLLALFVLAIPVLEGCSARYEYSGRLDGRPGWRERHRGNWRHRVPGRHRGRHHVMLAQVNASEITSSASIAALVEDYGLKPSSATKLNTLLLAEDKEVALASMGLTVTEFAPLANFELPSSASINKVAKLLNEEPATIRQIMADFTVNIKTERTDVNSEYWQDCITAGTWVTPQNGSCEKDWWTGCSPSTGASACTPTM